MVAFIKEAYLSSFKEKSIPSLDGLRAISILLVILGHSSFIFDKTLPFLANYFSILQGYGVSIFFGLSGFLICSILLKDKNNIGKVNLKLFYIKRLFRIFPPYYFYLLCVYIISSFYEWGPTKVELVAAILYLWNYVYQTKFWLLGHSWSLSVEEQFYIFWPLMVSILSWNNLKKTIIGLILFSPLIRLGMYYLFPEWRGRISIMLHTRIDSLMYGCLLAFYYDSITEKLSEIVAKYKLIPILLTFCLAISPLLRYLFKGAYGLPIGYSVEGLSFVLLIFVSMKLNSNNIIFKFLNNRWMRHIGILSYGLYLWQQLFLYHEINFSFTILRYLGLYFTVLVIYICIEYPIMKFSVKYRH